MSDTAIKKTATSNSRKIKWKDQTQQPMKPVNKTIIRALCITHKQTYICKSYVCMYVCLLCTYNLTQ